MSCSEPAVATAEANDCAPAYALLKRTLGAYAGYFELRLLPSGGLDRFSVNAANGRVYVEGSCVVALCRGVYHYLRTAGFGMITWSGTRVELPDPLPDFPGIHIECPNRLRYYLNVCTFGYSTVFWNWERWERELDWMALHGINMPLAHVGQEEIWRRVWRHYGFSNEELSAYFTGPTYLPWHRMGNINHHDGPLPESWYSDQVALQHRILNRMRELGMFPVSPAFGGFVPAGLAAHQPSILLLEVNPWAGFDKACQTYMLSPECDLFGEIAQRFLREYTAEFGAVQHYLADPLNEVELPPAKGGAHQFLAKLGEVISCSIEAAVPGATWVMQGWMFHFHRQFWTTPAVKAFLSNVPDDSMIILDLCNELFAGSQKLQRFFGKQWMYGVVHNFGGNNPLNGDLNFYSSQPSKSIGRDNRVGFAISPEGIENNELVYELLTDVAWEKEPINVGQWMRGYCASRYGTCTEDMARAWGLVRESVYRGFHTNIRHGFQGRPSLQPRSRTDVGPNMRQAVNAILNCSPHYQSVQFYESDAVELCAHYLGTCIDERLREAGFAHTGGISEYRDTCAKGAIELMLDLDALLATRPGMRLENWFQFARDKATSPQEASYYERDARRILTRWGGPALSDYSARLWSGLIRDYYVGRWRTFYDGLWQESTGDVLEFEERWIASQQLSAVRVVTNPIAECRRLLAMVDSWEHRPLDHRGVGDCIGHWNPDVVSSNVVSLNCNVSDFIVGGGVHQVVFRHTAGESTVKIDSVRLLENGVEIAADVSSGFVGRNSSHVSRLNLAARKPGTDYVVHARLHPDNGNDSSGGVWLQTGARNK